MEKKEDRWKKPFMPAFTSAICPGQLINHFEPAPEQAHTARIFETRSSVVKEHFDHDMERLRQSLAPGRLDAKPAMAPSATPANLHLEMRQNIDPRTGHVDSMKMLPLKSVVSLQPNTGHPMHPENQLSVASTKFAKKFCAPGSLVMSELEVYRN